MLVSIYPAMLLSGIRMAGVNTTRPSRHVNIYILVEIMFIILLASCTLLASWHRPEPCSTHATLRPILYIHPVASVDEPNSERLKRHIVISITLLGGLIRARVYETIMGQHGIKPGQLLGAAYKLFLARNARGMPYSIVICISSIRHFYLQMHYS